MFNWNLPPVIWEEASLEVIVDGLMNDGHFVIRKTDKLIRKYSSVEAAKTETS